MTVYEQVIQMLDEAVDYARHGELDEWTPFDPVDTQGLEEAEARLSTIQLVKKAITVLEKMQKQHLVNELEASGLTFSMRDQVFPAARFGPTVYAYRAKPTDPKVADAVGLFDWLGSDTARVVRPAIRKAQLRAVVEERATSVQALIDTGFIEWEFPDEGKPVLEVIDLQGYRPPKWAENVKDEWENKE